MQENHDEEPEVRVLTAAEGPAAGAVKKGILGNKQVGPASLSSKLVTAVEKGVIAGNKTL